MVSTENEEPPGARLIALMRAAETPLDTVAIARMLGLHPNGVRVQLKRLERVGLVEREHARGLVGRPKAIWRLTPRAIAQADLPHTGWVMARSLARAVPVTPKGLREVEDIGSDMGLELAKHLGPPPDGDTRQVFGDALEALGFEPARTDAGDHTCYRLTTCPYADIVRENPEVVCTLHRGIVRGILESVAPDAQLSAFEPRDPDVADCIVEVKVR